MSRIAGVLSTLRESGRKALIPYVTAGDPSPEGTVAVMHALAEGGADVIELGVPFSDPMADGPVIQRSSERALARGAGIRYVLECVRAFRERDASTAMACRVRAESARKGEGMCPAGGRSRSALSRI